jgi:hypothetical protein
MSNTGRIFLRDRVFRVKRADLTRHGDLWHIEIETEFEEFDGERWAPYLYHQGLRMSALTVADLKGQVTSWRLQTDSTYPHPEVGTMYVFGHHDVRHSTLTFGRYEAGRIELNWEGLCDVFWEGEFSEDVPFRCKCSATARDA